MKSFIWGFYLKNNAMRPLIFSFSFAKMKINEKPCNVSLLSKVIRIFLIFLFFSQKQIVDREISKRNFSGKKMSSNIYYIFWLWLMFALLMKQNNLTQLVSPLCIPWSVFLSIKVTISSVLNNIYYFNYFIYDFR